MCCGQAYLSVHRAAALIVRDMYERNRPPFDTLPVGVPQFGRKIARLQEELTSKVQNHLLQAIEKGRLHSVSRSNTYPDFIEHGDQADAARSHIFYGDLINWLVNSGYEDSRFLAVGPAFEEYERQELELGKEVEHLLRRRRERKGADPNEIPTASTSMDDGYTDYLEDALQSRADVISELKQRLGLKPMTQEAGPLHPKERESLLALVAALYKARDKKLNDKELVGTLALPTAPNGRKLSQNTVRKYLDEAGSLPPSSRNKNKTSIAGKNSIDLKTI